MAYALEAYSARHTAAAVAFNERMRAAEGDAEAGFLLPEQVPDNGSRYRRFVVTEGEAVRGGCMVELRSHWLAGAAADVWNVQAPLGEGLIDRRHANVAQFMMKSLLALNPRIYAVGMGSLTRPFPRLLKAMGWKVIEVPFFFRVLNGNNFLRQLPALRQPAWRRRVTAIGAATHLGTLAFRLLHWRAGGQDRVEEVPRFTEVANTLWQEQREQWAFASFRDTATLNEIYLPGRRGQRWQFTDGAGWAFTTLADFRNHAHFGTMRVGTIADFAARPGRHAALIEQTVVRMGKQGADLVVSNQSDPAYQEALRARGFLTGPSNFLFAASKALAATIADGRLHLNRGDGDGLIHLE